MNLSEIRQEINSIDDELLLLLKKRNDLVQGVAEYKEEHGIPVFDPEREKAHLKSLVDKGLEIELPEVITTEIFVTIMDGSKGQQASKRGQNFSPPIETRYCPICEFNTDGIEGPKGATKRICPKCRRPLTLPRKPTVARSPLT